MTAPLFSKHQKHQLRNKILYPDFQDQNSLAKPNSRINAIFYKIAVFIKSLLAEIR